MIADRGQGTSLQPVNVLGNSEPFGNHGRNAVRLMPRKVIQFGAVEIEIVKLPLSQFSGDQLPRALTQCAIGSKVKIQRLVRLALPCIEDRQQRLSFKRVDEAAAELRWVGRAGQLDECGHEVDEVCGLTGNRTGLRLESSGPVNDQR